MNRSFAALISSASVAAVDVEGEDAHRNAYIHVRNLDTAHPWRFEAYLTVAIEEREQQVGAWVWLSTHAQYKFTPFMHGED